MMKRLLLAIASRLWPDFETLAEPDRQRALRELFGMLFGLPFLILSVSWLVAATDLDVVRGQWMLLLLFLGLSLVADRLSFFQITVDKSGTYSYNGSSLEGIIVVSAVLLLGPTAAWVLFLHLLLDYGLNWPRSPSKHQRWNRLRNATLNMGGGVAALLLAVLLYQQLGGTFPFSGGAPRAIWPALGAVLFLIPMDGLLFFCYGALMAYFQLSPHSLREWGREIGQQLLRFFLVAEVPSFFGILVAAVYSRMGLAAYLFLVTGVLLVSFLARRLSQQARLGQQRSREVTRLEELGRSIIAAPADGSTLAQVLATHLPGMFSYQQVEIRLFPGQTVLQMPEDRPPVRQATWDWLGANPQPRYFAPGQSLPWSGQVTTQPWFLVPIQSTQQAEPLGGICLTLDRLYYEDILTYLRPALQVLAAQIASALHRAEVHAQTLAHQRKVQELAFAWQIQASFLPDSLPQVEGWQLTATLNPCQETSGDFYDVIPLPNGHLGLLIADVADKGMGAALFMALSRTLIRTYAIDHPLRPDLVLKATNQRILTDTHTDMFVTVFYAALDPDSGRLVYANAGHNPPYLFKTAASDAPVSLPQPQGLRNTGMPLGILQEASWDAKTVELAPGDTLVLYTDGITEAHSQQVGLFGERRLIELAQAHLEEPVQSIQESILSTVTRFSEDGLQCDDATLMILKRLPPHS
ncbi:MAG: SpoIIE family protein phosphatase [Anaerolineales bacterium]|nr:MAG: SpoIIE family protein phosphatase [Anaerolineales bacterium]